MTLFEMKEKLFNLDAEIETINSYIAEKAADPSVTMDDITAKQKKLDEVNLRKSLLQKQHDDMEAKQKAALHKEHGSDPRTPEQNVIKAKADLFRGIATKSKELIDKSYQGLGGIPAGVADMGSGSNLLPVNVATEIITEPFESNSLREVEQTTNVRGLEEPRIAFAIDDDDLLEDVVDFETAKEIQATSDMVTYNRLKTKVKITVADTIVYGTDTALVSTVENELRSGLARKEKLRAFAKSADADHQHMSFYMVGIKGVTGASVVAAIMAALGDLDDLFRANAKVIMRAQDWYTYIQTLANGAGELFMAKPQDVIGVPVIFNDRATIPVIGDFRYAKQNYDPDAVLDADKDIDTGAFKYVLTAWGDHQIKLKSAFRLAIVAVAIIGGIAKPATASALAGEVLTAVGVFNTDTANIPSSGVTYLWQSLQAGTWTDLTSAYTGYNTASLTTVNSQDEGVQFRCKITYSAVSAYTNALTMA
ncbi:MAG: phage major capsid protein [Eubacteriales bacterium]|nr:phage major capsid protein [Eubacteriales bacterium]